MPALPTFVVNGVQCTWQNYLRHALVDATAGARAAEASAELEAMQTFNPMTHKNSQIVGGYFYLAWYLR